MIINDGPYRRHKIFTLNENYPADAVAYYTSRAGASATFHVEIADPGKPEKYTYQWYLDGEKVEGATDASYTASGFTADGTHDIYCVVTNKAGSVTSKTAKLKVSKKYLYKNGDQCEDVTGGWTAYNSGQSVGGVWYPEYYGAAVLQADRMRMTSNIKDTYGGKCVTNRMVDVSDHSKLKFDHYTYGRSTYIISTTQNESGTVRRVNVPLKYDSSGTIEMDVSDLSGAYYVICVGGTGTGAGVEHNEVFNVWLD